MGQDLNTQGFQTWEVAEFQSYNGGPTPHFTCESQFQVRLQMKGRYVAESYIAVLRFLGFKVQEVSILETEAH